jgi:hypothetical protein
MSRNRVIRLSLAGAALAAGLGVAANLNAGGADTLRPRSGPVRAAFSAPAVDAVRPAPVYYQAQVRDLTRGDEQTISPLPFTMAYGAADSHVVWLTLDFYHSYLVRVRGVAASGAIGLWSAWSDQYENVSPEETPEPPTD